MDTLRNKAAIVGAADTEVGMVPNLSTMQLIGKAAKLALADAGLTKDNVDGLLTTNSFVDPIRFHAEVTAEYLQIFPSYCMTIPTGGANIQKGLHHAASAIMAGICNTVLFISADNVLSGLSRSGTIDVFAQFCDPQFEMPYGPPVFGDYAILAQAHTHKYGTTMEQRAAVAVACRKHASLNPAAQMRKPITIDDVLDSKIVASPLHMLDCSVISDGGGAIVITSAERARDFPKKPVYLLGVGEGHSHENVSQAHELAGSISCRAAGDRAYKMAGVTPKDIDVAELYDCFTESVIVELEELGFCPRGEGGRYAEGGRIELGGELPINTHGGMLSYAHPGHPGAMFNVTEAVKQLRGECGPRQVKDAKIALTHGLTGILSSHCTAILGNEPIR